MLFSDVRLDCKIVMNEASYCRLGFASGNSVSYSKAQSFENIRGSSLFPSLFLISLKTY